MARQKPLQGEVFARSKGYFFCMWFLKQLHNLVFRRESSIFFQTCHILSLCVGVLTLPGKKKKKKRRIHCWVVYQKVLPVTGSWDRCSGVPEEDGFLSCFALMLSFVAQHRTGSHHRSEHVRVRHRIADGCRSVRRMPLNPLPYRQMVDKPFFHVTPPACLMKKTNQDDLMF